MELFRIIGKGIIKNLESKKITLKQAIEYAGDPRYAEYEFTPIDENNLQAGCIAKKRVQPKENRKKLNFQSYIKVDEQYKNINENMNTKNKELKNYNNYQSAKRYKADMYR